MSELLMECPVVSIFDNADGLRDAQTDKTAFIELVETIRQNGLINAITITPHKRADGVEGYILVDGTQRLAACRALGYKTIPAKVMEGNQMDHYSRMLVANAARVETKRAEYAATLLKMLRINPMWTHHDLAAKTGKSAAWVSDTLSLNRLFDDAKVACNNNEITGTNAINLAKLPHDEQRAFLEQAKALTPSEFVPLVADRLKQLKDARAKGEAKPERRFPGNSAFRKLAELEAELASGAACRDLVTETTTPQEAFFLGIKFALSIDPVTFAAREQEWQAKEDANKAKAEENKKEREAKAAAAKAKREQEAMEKFAHTIA